ncbi:hypothetical protein EON81_17970 [bacterium]|nr:MAG: hypothetical protein EON81_17970 [bacterium]
MASVLDYMSGVARFDGRNTRVATVVREPNLPFEKPTMDPVAAERSRRAQNLPIQALRQAQLDLAKGNLDGALTSARYAKDLSRRIGSPLDSEADLIMGRVHLARGEYREALTILAKQEDGYSDDLLFAEIALCRLHTGDLLGAEASFQSKNGLDSPAGFTEENFPSLTGAKGLECRLLLKIAGKYAYFGYKKGRHPAVG